MPHTCPYGPPYDYDSSPSLATVGAVAVLGAMVEQRRKSSLPGEEIEIESHEREVSPMQHHDTFDFGFMKIR